MINNIIFLPCHGADVFTFSISLFMHRWKASSVLLLLFYFVDKIHETIQISWGADREKFIFNDNFYSWLELKYTEFFRYVLQMKFPSWKRKSQTKLPTYFIFIVVFHGAICGLEKLTKYCPYQHMKLCCPICNSFHPSREFINEKIVLWTFYYFCFSLHTKRGVQPLMVRFL